MSSYDDNERSHVEMLARDYRALRIERDALRKDNKRLREGLRAALKENHENYTGCHALVDAIESLLKEPAP